MRYFRIMMMMEVNWYKIDKKIKYTCLLICISRKKHLKK